MSRRTRVCLATAMVILCASCGGGGGSSGSGDQATVTTSATPAGGVYQSAQTVTLACTAPGAPCSATYFTTDGTEPTTSSTPYTGPLHLLEDTTLRYFSVDADGVTETPKTSSYAFRAEGTSSTHGPDGGTVQCLAVAPSDSSVVYAGSQAGGVYRRAGGGTTWNHAGLYGHGLAALAVDPADPDHVLAVGTDGLGTQVLYGTQDAGSSWTRVNTTGFGRLYDVLFDPSESAVAYLATETGLRRSTDGGVTWPAGEIRLGGTNVRCLAVDPSDPDRFHAGSALPFAAHRSMDGGLTWTTSTTGLVGTAAVATAVDPNDSARVYLAGTDGEGLFVSTDGGGTWGSTPGAVAYMKDLVVSATQGVFVARWATGLLRSADAGSTWNLLDVPGYTTGPLCLALDPNDASRVHAGFWYGAVQESSDGGTTWDLRKEGLRALPDAYVACLPGAPNVVVSAARGAGLLRSEDRGDTWSWAWDTGNSQIFVALVPDPHDRQKIYVSTTHTFHRSLDGGLTWTEHSTAPGYSFPNSIGVHPAVDGLLYCGNYTAGPSGPVYEIRRSLDHGATWASANGTLSSDARTEDLAFDAVSIGTVYAATTLGIARTTDGGGDWAIVNDQLRNQPQVQAHPTIGGLVYASDLSLGVHRSVDGGATWSPIDSGLPSTQIIVLAMDPTLPHILYLGTRNDGVFRSEDGGDSWVPLSAGLPAGSVQDIAVDPTDSRIVYVSIGGASVWTVELDL